MVGETESYIYISIQVDAGKQLCWQHFAPIRGKSLILSGETE